MGNIFDVYLVNPIINILVVIYQVLFFLGVPYALGFSIIILTVFIRLLLYPLTASQLKVSKKMQDIAPHVNKIKEKHKGDTQQIHKETMALYKEHGVNPAAGCLPILIQLPLFWALYSVLQKIVLVGKDSIVLEINKIVYPLDFLKLSQPWDQSFFGIPLGQNPSQLISVMPLIILVPILTGVFQFIQSKMMFSSAASAPKTEKDEKKKNDDFAKAFQTQSLYLFPVMIGFFSYTFPIGLSLYWNTFTLFGILQQYRVAGLGGLTDWIEHFKKV